MSNPQIKQGSSLFHTCSRPSTVRGQCQVYCCDIKGTEPGCGCSLLATYQVTSAVMRPACNIQGN
jgi:hypothetical protein